MMIEESMTLIVKNGKKENKSSYPVGKLQSKRNSPSPLNNSFFSRKSSTRMVSPSFVRWSAILSFCVVPGRPRNTPRSDQSRRTPPPPIVYVLHSASPPPPRRSAISSSSSRTISSAASLLFNRHSFAPLFSRPLLSVGPTIATVPLRPLHRIPVSEESLL